MRGPPNPGGYLGPWIMALVGISFTVGVMAVQSARYFSLFGYEGKGLFTLVISCILLSIAQWVIMMHGIWDWFVDHFGDWARFASITWQSPTLLIISRLIGFVAQLFFVHRCYLLYDRSKLVYGGLMIGAVTTLVLFTVIGTGVLIDPITTPLPNQLMIPGLCINLGTDVAITILTLWKLEQGDGQTYNPKTKNVLHRLRNATLEAAAPPAICAIINLLTYLRVRNLTHNWFVMMTSRFYVWSLFFTLNSRIAFRQKLKPTIDNTDQTLSTGFEFAGPSRV